MIGEGDIRYAADQQNEYMSNQGNSFINFISRALDMYIHTHIYIYPIFYRIFLLTEADEIYYGHHESSELHTNDLNAEENKVLPIKYYWFTKFDFKIIKLDPAMYSFSMFAKICIILGGRW